MAGLVFGLIAFIVLGVSGIVSGGGGEIILLFLQFLSLVAAGYVAGRLSSHAEVHGGLAGLLTAAVSSAIVLATTQVSITALVTLTVVAAVLGSAGGVLARWQKDQIGT
jgi:hypothetical protein